MIFIAFYCNVSYGATITYTYDNLNRLTKVIYGDGTTEEFTYDATGNRFLKVELPDGFNMRKILNCFVLGDNGCIEVF